MDKLQSLLELIAVLIAIGAGAYTAQWLWRRYGPDR